MRYPHHAGGSRARGPGFRRLRAAAVVAACGAVVSGCGSTKPAASGGLPGYLPKSAAPVDQVVTASATQPRLAVQGVAVHVDLPGGRTLATIAGPRLPPFVAPPPPSVTATFTVTLAQVSGLVPVRLDDFSIHDQLGRTVTPLLVAGEAPPPAAAPVGATMAFQVTAVLPVGEGQIEWAPGGGRPIVSWDFAVEND